MPLSSEQLLKLEKRTLEKIATLRPFDAFPELKQQAQAGWRLIDPDRSGLNFHAVFQLTIIEETPTRKKEKPRRFDIGGLVEVSAPQRQITRSSYQLVIGKGHDQTKPILRKLHFDFEPKSSRSDHEPKPSIHLQFGGELLPQWAGGKGYQLNQLQALSPWFEKPRVPCLPVCLALLLDWTFLEFSHNRHAKAVIDNPDWNAHVREAERLVLAQFIDDCQAFLQSAARKKHRLLHHLLYEMPIANEGNAGS